VYVIDIAAEFGVKRQVKGVDDWTPEEEEQEEGRSSGAPKDSPTDNSVETPKIVDAEYSQPFEDWKTLLDELEAYQPGLTRRPSMIIANKADVTEVAPKNLLLFQKLVHEEWAKRRAAYSSSSSSLSSSNSDHDLKIVPVSAKYKKNIVKVTSILREIVEAEKAKEVVATHRKEQREKEEQEEALAFKATRRNIMNASKSE